MTKALDLLLRMRPDTEVIGVIGGNEKGAAIKLVSSVLKQQFKTWDKPVVDLDKVKITPRIAVLMGPSAPLDDVPKHGWIIFNGDDSEVRKIIKETKSPALKISYGSGPQNDVVISQPKKGEIAVTLNTGIRHVFSFLPTTKINPVDIAPSIVIGLLEGLDFDKIQQGLK